MNDTMITTVGATIAATLISSLVTFLATQWRAKRLPILEIDDPSMNVFIEEDFRAAVAQAKRFDVLHVVDIWNRGRSPLVKREFEVIGEGKAGEISHAGIVFHSGTADRPIVKAENGRITINHNFIAPNEPLRIWVITSGNLPLRLHCSSDELRTRSRPQRLRRRIPILN